jgi:hypothetical protein
MFNLFYFSATLLENNYRNKKRNYFSFVFYFYNNFETFMNRWKISDVIIFINFARNIFQCSNGMKVMKAINSLDTVFFFFFIIIIKQS